MKFSPQSVQQSAYRAHRQYLYVLKHSFLDGSLEFSMWCENTEGLSRSVSCSPEMQLVGAELTAAITLGTLTMERTGLGPPGSLSPPTAILGLYCHHAKINPCCLVLE